MSDLSDDVITEHVEWIVASKTLEEAIVFAQDHGLLRASDWAWAVSDAREVRAYRLSPEAEVAPAHPVGRGEAYAPRLLPAQMVAAHDRNQQRLNRRALTRSERFLASFLPGRSPAATSAAKSELDRYLVGELTAEELEVQAMARVRRHFADERAIADALVRRQAAHNELLARLPLSLDGPIPMGVNYAWVRFFVELAEDAGLDVERIDGVAAQIAEFIAQLDAFQLPPFQPELDDRETYIRDLVDGGPEWPDRRDEAIRLLIEGGAI